ncbi:UV-stimulated scaffold protein A like [Apostasia shenzhenica]|uniref:UV-stimulated scaffold protein A like n=1 Tax=Apostasia shenzhenica TaxID=1088818 RepID=A0A2I0AFT4_9ASPA|nr:UV-stimulated scaffold protein A like [Apostasia shenzhenica]
MKSSELTSKMPVAAAVSMPRLIEKATNSTTQEVDPHLLKAIKLSARSSEAEIYAAANALMEQMKKPHSQVRYLTVLVIDELFMRSKLFRNLFVVNFDQFLSLSVGFRRNLPLPPPASIATNLRSKSVELLEKWNDSFGIHYKQLRLGFDYLKNTLRFQFPNHLENAARLQKERSERELKTKQILLNKFESLKDNFASIKSDVQSTVDEIGECLDIATAKEGNPVDFSIDDYEGEELNSFTLRQIRIESLKEGEKVQENSENEAIFDVLRESYKLLISKHLVSVQEWISVLVRVDTTDHKFRDIALKEFIDLQNLIHSVKKRCIDFGLALDEVIAQTEELWEEGTIEPCMEDSPTCNSIAVEKPLVRPVPSSMESKSSSGEPSTIMSERGKLLAEAPVLPWSLVLDNWGSRRDVLANQRGLELEAHWGRVDPDAVIPAEKIAELSVHCTVYKEHPVDIRPCLAPLRKGGLCQRRDLKLCPLHGPIILRDPEGNPIQKDLHSEGQIGEAFFAEEICKSQESPCPSKEISEQLARQALTNVRERERETKSLKRAKLAQVRKHNEAVLREAAIASASYSESFEENADASQGNVACVNVKKPTLASMLKKKVTAKDRIARRLLNTRATDTSSRQLSIGEDSKYREAFPNQW